MSGAQCQKLTKNLAEQNDVFLASVHTAEPSAVQPLCIYEQNRGRKLRHEVTCTIIQFILQHFNTWKCI